MTKFSELVASLRRDGEDWGITVGDDWLQGRAVYGGLTASLCLHACHLQENDLPVLRSAQFAFVGPAVGRLRVRPTLLRRGKSSAFVGVELVGEMGLATRALFCFAADRASQLSHAALAYPSPPPPTEGTSVYEGSPLNLNFVQHFEARLVQGHLPFSQGAPEMTIWARHRDGLAAPSLTSLVALADATPPPALAIPKQPGPISTMTWSIDILSSDLEKSEGWWLFRTKADAVADGYSSQSTTIWSANGTPVMIGRQHLALFM
ncbi:thioesterase family protein [Bradyrhizobium sp. Arg68]|uniref:thioesterase family protein n=1 Tax=Bradyrhizobium ivorense TaxID=2511166 RepID=UPI001E3BBB4D|nr:thioesterase family protein [Bradyrhizobium ivorense]MCC8936582.1 thioesterase family protein [Bradyrhizobium ivorense]